MFKDNKTLSIYMGVFLILSLILDLVFKMPELSSLLLAITGFIGLLPIAKRAYTGLKFKIVTIELLVSLAIIGGFLIKNFEESAVVGFLFILGAYIEEKTIKKTRASIKNLREALPEYVYRIGDNREIEELNLEDIKTGDLLLIKSGSSLGIDGHIEKGRVRLNESPITGEAFPVTKSTGDFVYAGSIVEDGSVEVRVDKLGEETSFGKIIKLVEEAQDIKSSAEKFMDKFASYYTPVVLILALTSFIISKNIELGITILVLGCPGALVIGVPISNVAGIGNGAKHGILIKGSEVIHNFSKTKTIVFDKTGSLTLGRPKVTEAYYYQEDHKRIKNYLASIEEESSHPLAGAVLDYIGDYKKYELKENKLLLGLGVKSEIGEDKLLIGSLKLMKSQGVLINKEAYSDIKKLEEKGSSIVLMAINSILVLALGIRDQLRPSIKEELRHLKKLGIKRFIILSGDNQGAVDIVAKELGIREAYGGMLPEDKADYIKRLKSGEKYISFLGDGINDSPSLALADIGISLASGTDIAIENSDIIFIGSDLRALSTSLRLSKASVRNMRINIGIALASVIFLLYSLIFTSWMNMALGMLIHEGSIILVSLNGLLLSLRKFNSKEEVI